MLLRLVLALGGITFIATGIGIFLADSCSSVTWGSRGSERAGNFSATCNDALVEGAMSQGAAGILALLGGLLLLTTAAMPLIRSRASVGINR